MTAIISINDVYRIELDQYSWQVSRWKTRKNHPSGGNWEGISWHRTLQQAGESLVERFVSQDDLEGVQEIIDALHASSSLIARSIWESTHQDSWMDERRARDGAD